MKSLASWIQRRLHDRRADITEDTDIAEDAGLAEDADITEDTVKRALEPYFDRDYYLSAYPDVQLSGQDPLTHYVKWGDREGRRPSATFDPAQYRLRHSPTRANALYDAIVEGKLGQETSRETMAAEYDAPPRKSAGRDPSGPVPAPPNGFFRLISKKDVTLIASRMNESWYFARYPDAVEFGGSAAAHYLGVGWLLGYDPTPSFSTQYYLRANRDVARDGLNPFLHYLMAGHKEAWRKTATVDEAEVHNAFEGPLAEDLAEAIALDPMVALPLERRKVTSPFDLPRPARDALQILRRDLSAQEYPHVILIPQVRMSGAARVAGIYAATLADQVGAENLLIVRTDGEAFEHPEWFPADVRSYDLSTVLAPVREKQLHPQLLVDLLRGVGARSIHLFNSRLGWDTLQVYGRQLSQETAVTAYLFTWEETADGRKIGYPIQWLHDTIDYCHVIVCDSDVLADHIRQRFGLPASGFGAPVVALTPADLPDPASFQIYQQHRLSRAPSNRVLWAGRLDRQKRPDLLAAIARTMPDTQFEVYGRAVLDKAPEGLKKLPNIAMMGEYDDFATVVERDYDAFLYTAQWDGTPTILLDAIGHGLPVVASAVGGIAKLLEDGRGQVISDIENIEAYRTALTEIIENPSVAAECVGLAYDHARTAYAPAPYAETVREVLDRMEYVSAIADPQPQPSAPEAAEAPAAITSKTVSETV
ncbi:glycosyltransferase family 4 protein [Paracoccus pacificus]|uniref:Glycosyltransferase family 4 protein n=1 Tax=Paracoccus pacificus TaxID=1463598 RepID=A0ABW4R6T3_9RHOB